MQSWREALDLSKLGEEERRKILDYLLRFKNISHRDLGISKSTFHRIVHRKIGISDVVLQRMLELIDEKEFEQIIGAESRLRAMGILREDGSIDYGVAVAVLGVATRDEYLKQLILRFVVKEFRDDLRKMLGLSLAHVEFRWSEDFEQFLRVRKKRRKVLSDDTIRYYRSLFERYLEGKTLSENLVEAVVKHENKWLRNVFRHYIQYLYYRRRIPPETFGWLMEVVPSRSYRFDVRPYRIGLEDVRKTMEFLKQKHEKYYVLYRLMLESGARLSHAIHVIKTFNPEEMVEIPGVDIVTKRLVCFDKHCRYYAGLGKGSKPCEWIWFSKELLPYLEKYRGVEIRRHVVRKYAAVHNLVRAKYMRKVNWRIMTQVIQDKDVARFIQSRFGELRISEARYGDLLSRADREYPKVLAKLGEVLRS